MITKQPTTTNGALGETRPTRDNDRRRYADGTGVGTLSDPVHSTVNSHLAVQQTSGQGNHFHCEGVVLASNGGTPVGQPFVVDGVVHENFTALALRMDDAVFLGKGFLVSAPMFAIPGLGR